jgi:hypothetical protein
LGRLKGLYRLPLIAEPEMEGLFGEEVAGTLARLGRLDQQERTCLQCPSKCCNLVQCEFFIPCLDRCPIHAFRPVLCRMHFCGQFAGEDRDAVKELGDIFLEGLLAAEPLDREKASLLDSPPFGLTAPRLVAAILPLIKAIREKSLEEKIALNQINELAAGYRIF